CLARPIEWSGNAALIFLSEAQRVVRARAAEVIPHCIARMIEIGARIDQHRSSVDVQPDGQRVGVTVGRDREIAERSVIEYQQRLAAVDRPAENGVTARIKM